jgi:hypothetical protein
MCKVAPSTCEVAPSTCKVAPSTCEVAPSTCKVAPSTLKLLEVQKSAISPLTKSLFSFVLQPGKQKQIIGLCGKLV